MGDAFDRAAAELRAHPRRWLVTGAAGFIGSHVVETLLRMGQEVIGFDNFETGHHANLDGVERALDRVAWRAFRFVEADIRDAGACASACDGVDIVSHQAALGSVPRSIADPATTNAVNVTGFVNMLVAARDAGVGRLVYASSSSVYGDHPDMPKVEDATGSPLSPYAASKRTDELYAAAFQASYDLECIGLRYFNVFGPRQDPEGPYTAVIPRWVGLLADGKQCTIYGDGETSRDFCYVANVVRANVLAAICGAEATNSVYNVACGERTNLNDLYEMIRARVARENPAVADLEPTREPFRPGDVRHSLASIERARSRLGYEPREQVGDGMDETVASFLAGGGS